MLSIVSMLEWLMWSSKMLFFYEALVATRGGQLTEDSARSIVTGETGFAHTRAVVLSAHVLLIYSLCDAGFGCRMLSTRRDAHFGVVAKSCTFCCDQGP